MLLTLGPSGDQQNDLRRKKRLRTSPDFTLPPVTWPGDQGRVTHPDWQGHHDCMRGMLGSGANPNGGTFTKRKVGWGGWMRNKLNTDSLRPTLWLPHVHISTSSRKAVPHLLSTLPNRTQSLRTPGRTPSLPEGESDGQFVSYVLSRSRHFWAMSSPLFLARSHHPLASVDLMWDLTLATTPSPEEGTRKTEDIHI